MKLALCIPTHHGRANDLRELLDSIFRQKEMGPDAAVQICISDNAAEDGTDELVREYEKRSPFPVTYFRQSTNVGGIRNFFNVVDIATAEFCWLIGSDDLLVENAISKVLAVLSKHPQLAGLSVNKLNVNPLLFYASGPDHPIVLPPDSENSRLISSNALRAFAPSFLFMSAHIFRRTEWQEFEEDYGIEYVESLGKFPHTVVFCHILARRQSWYWLSDYCVLQRVANFVVLEENDNRYSKYAMDLGEDVIDIWRVIFGRNSRCFRDLTKVPFLIFFNPEKVLLYKLEPAMSFADELQLCRFCFRFFWRIPYFWIFSLPVLLTPAFLFRRPIPFAWVAEYLVTNPPRVWTTLRMPLRWLGLAPAAPDVADAARQIVFEQTAPARKIRPMWIADNRKRGSSLPAGPR
jgi:abequosyltransferase